MNQDQRDYAIGRITDIRDEKLAAAHQAHTTPGKKLDRLQRLALIRRGAVLLLPKAKIPEDDYERANISRVFDFSKFEWPDKLNKAAFGKRADVLRKKHQWGVDQIMLGDPKETIRIIREFEAV